MTEPNSVPETNQSTDLAAKSQTNEQAEANPSTNLLCTTQATDLVPGPQAKKSRREQKLLTMLPKEDQDTGIFKFPDPPMSFDEDLRTQEKTPLNLQYLRFKQRVVLAELMKGNSISTIAEQQQLSRNTIYYWMRHDQAFIAAVDAWRRRARQEAADQLLLLTDRAVSAVRRAVFDNNLRAALSVLKSQGLMDRPAPAKPRAQKRPKPMTPNVVMEHRRATVAVSVPPPEKKEVRQLPDAGCEK